MWFIAALLSLTSVATLTFSAPAGWKPAATSSSMRVAQFGLPRAAGDGADVDLVVYFIKLTGPATTVAASEKFFETFLSSAQVA